MRAGRRDTPLARRLARCRHSPPGGAARPFVYRAESFRARLLGLALLHELPDDVALLLPRTRCIHTFLMRCAIDLVWLDHAGRAIRIDRAVVPRRLARCKAAAHVLELPAGGAARARLFTGADGYSLLS
ncbi:MAG TPA: DUF192 domain-containing protein [Solirubrobacteraceae bacterium]|nr:DUF192 domain-containing protein [Solirubrobacteraceae bacterium]